MTRSECGYSIWGSDYNASSGDSIRTGVCVEDPDDGFLWAERYYGDLVVNDENEEVAEENVGQENVEDVGLRLCLTPNLLAKAFPGSYCFIVEQTPTVIAYSNYVLIYGLLFLLLEVVIRRYGERLTRTRLAWLAGWSVFNEWKGLFTGKMSKRAKTAVLIIAKYAVDWAIGFVVVSPLALLIPGFPDLEFSVPEAISVVVAGGAIAPLLLMVHEAFHMLRSELRACSGVGKWDIVRQIYLGGFLPIALLFSCMTIRDYTRPFWRD